ncbi:MAG: SRPBCC domain-containing protein [Thermomicrobiales bacterium]|nr:SRPBCC domain-containing protein [Thermomicrobiales bacterium]
MAQFDTSIEIDAAPADVFTYLTTNAGMTAWMGTQASLDPRPGGRFEVDIAGYAIRGQYLEVDPPHRIVVSWGMIENPLLPPGSSTVEFRLTPIGERTRVDLIHADLPETELPGHADGWAHFMPRLAVVGAGGDAGPDDWRPLGVVHGR